MRRQRDNVWNRKLWGVLFTNGRDEAMLIGALWDDQEAQRSRAARESEPTRALLFLTRKQAQSWCKAKHASFGDYPPGHVFRSWRFMPVRVRETVQVLR